MPDILACPGCGQSLKEGYHPITMTGGRKAFVCSEECAGKWLRFIGEIRQCAVCREECPVSGHPYIDWQDGTEEQHFCSDDHVIEWMAREGAEWASPKSQEDVGDER